MACTQLSKTNTMADTVAVYERKVENFSSCCLKTEFVTEPLTHNWTKETQYTQSVVLYPDK